MMGMSDEQYTRVVAELKAQRRISEKDDDITWGTLNAANLSVYMTVVESSHSGALKLQTPLKSCKAA